MNFIRTLTTRRSYTLAVSLIGLASLTGATVFALTALDRRTVEAPDALAADSPALDVAAAVAEEEALDANVVATASSVAHAEAPASVSTAVDARVAARPTTGDLVVDPTTASGLEEPSFGPSVVEAEIGSGQTLASSMSARGIDRTVVNRIALEMVGHFDFRRSQPGHRYQLVRSSEGEIESFSYRTSNTVSYELTRDRDGRFDVARVEATLEPRETMIAGVVTSSLYAAITDLGGGAQLANDFSDVFAYDVDFSRMVRPGDEFRILYERLYRRGESGEDIFVRPGRILAASYGGAGGEHVAVYYESEEGRGGYYRPDGSPVERQFLRAPLRYSRISSRYSPARRHPILKVTRPHHGIDYAAPHGTPVYAVSPGKVTYKSWAGGFGRLVKVEHSDGYVSYYAHLSRFARGLAKGQDVAQKQVIGYVGSSGLATGPHVCFRVAKDGRYVNPIRLPSPASPPLPPEHQTTFRTHRDVLLAALDSGRLVTVDEAL